jgi:predicted DCC family thiol-disulfide oxidoreductase YuxK
MPSSRQTRAPGGVQWIVLYDGHCAFCEASVATLLRVVGPARLSLRSFQEPQALRAFPGIDLAACRERLHVVAPDGRVFAGAEALARCLALRPWGLVALAYYVPGVAWIAERAYAAVAARRYRLFVQAGGCASGACAIPAPALREKAREESQCEPGAPSLL